MNLLGGVDSGKLPLFKELTYLLGEVGFLCEEEDKMWCDQRPIHHRYRYVKEQIHLKIKQKVPPITCHLTSPILYEKSFPAGFGFLHIKKIL